jgi:tetratricopeptide (TPR) repeat protein
MRRFLLPSLPLLALLAASPVLAEDAPPAEPAAPKAEKPKTDDASIFADWKLCKQRGAAHCRGRAEFWAGKGVTGKDLVWLAKMWGRADEHQKAIDTAQQFLDWKPPADDPKAQETNAKNRPLAWTELIDHLYESRQYDKVFETAAKFRDEQSDGTGSVVAQYGWQIPGHAARAAGDEAKAIEFFSKAAELKFVAGILDLVDVHLAAGRTEDAKAAIAKYSEGLEKGGKELEWMKEFVAAVGSPAPALAEGKNVGPTDAPATWDKANILYLWAMQTPNPDRAPRDLEVLRRGTDGVTVIGVSTYKKYNPLTSKVEEDLPEEKEQELYRKMIADTFLTPTPPSIVVKPEWLDAVKLKWDRQFVIVDKEGKVRYARIFTGKDWDVHAVMTAAKRIAADAK